MRSSGKTDWSGIGCSSMVTRFVCSGDRAGDGGEDFANAQVVRSVQERRRLAGHSRARGKAPRKNAQVPRRRKECRAEGNPATSEHFTKDVRARRSPDARMILRTTQTRLSFSALPGRKLLPFDQHRMLDQRQSTCRTTNQKILSSGFSQTQILKMPDK